MNKLEKTNVIIEELKKNKKLKIDAICRDINISPKSLYRYISELKNEEWEIKKNKDTYYLKKEGKTNDYLEFKKGDYTLFKVLTYIYNNQKCSRVSIISFFCDKNKNDYMTIRNLDRHLSSLIKKNLIEKGKDEKKITYCVSNTLLSNINISLNDISNTLMIIKSSEELLSKDEYQDLYNKIRRFVMLNIKIKFK